MLESAITRVDDLIAKVQRLRSEVETAEKYERQTASQVEVAVAAIAHAEQHVKEVKTSGEAIATSISDARSENVRVKCKVEDAAAAAEALRQCFLQLGGGDNASNNAVMNSSSVGSKTLDFEAPGNKQEVGGGAAGSALQKLSDSDLNEVRKLAKPPQNVRRALELVHALLAAADGATSLPSPGSVQWSELQRMLAADGFIKRVLAMDPKMISRNEILLSGIFERWPSLQKAAETSAPAAFVSRRPASGGGWKAVRLATAKENSTLRAQQAGNSSNEGSSSNKSSSKISVKSSTAAVNTAPVKPAGKPPAAAPSRRAVAVAAPISLEDDGGPALGSAAPESSPTTADLLVEDVEYASKAAGALFRYCARSACAAMDIVTQRTKAKAELDAALQRLSGVTGEHAATQAYLQNLREQEQRHAEAQQAATAAVDEAQDARLDAKVTARKALDALEALRAALADAEVSLESAQDSLDRRREQAEKRKQVSREKADQEESDRRAAQEAIERDLATRPPERPVCWLHEPVLPEHCRRIKVEFPVNSASLPLEATAPLMKLAKELRASVSLRVHLAGHVSPDEDQRYASQRAMAVGAALIGLGVLPLQLRAKGYGAKVPISRVEKLKFGSKSLRRVTVHGLGEVKTREGCNFAAGSAELTGQVQDTLGKVAELLLSPEHKGMRLCVEGHTDSKGSEESNAKLSMERAEATSEYLRSRGVPSAQLSPHGFGAAFPIDDNESEEGRLRNRRIELLIIPREFDAAAKLLGAKDSAAALANHTSNRPGVAKFV